MSTQQHFQAVRLVNKDGLPAASPSHSNVVHIACHPDPSDGKDIILWDDILAAFKDALQIRYGTRILPFLKGPDFKNLDPLRIAAVPDTILDVVVEGQSVVTQGQLVAAETETALPPAYSTLDMSTLATSLPTANSQPVHAHKGNHLTSARTGDVASQIKLGSLYRDGQGVAQNYAMALEWYLRAANQGSASAQDHIGYLYHVGGPDFPKDYMLAMFWYMKAANQNNASAQGSVGELYQYGRGVRQDYEKAMDWYRKAAKQGHVWSQKQIAGLFKDGHGVKQDYHKTMKWYLKAAVQGDAQAQYNIGLLYNNGLGVKQDYGKALSWYRKATEQAQDSTGYLYHAGGPGFPVDYLKAMEWYLKAANQGYASAQDSVGEMYRHGRGVPQDYEIAMVWFLRAAEQGSVWAQNTVGDMYRDGLGVPKDDKKAQEWYLKANNQGNSGWTLPAKS
ncbi:hypothetical protein BGX23_012598 [Mortierella sp. AD031]|nr:hypothetical protein BGX23_012598 [Mortierella sp. AD031]